MVRVSPDGSREIVIEDSDPAHLEALETALHARHLTRPMIHEAKSRVLRNVSSIAFAGQDLRTAHLGSLAGEALATFRAPVAGVPPAHWEF